MLYQLLPPIQSQHHDRHTPQIAPIDHDTSTLNITPFLNGLIELAEDHIDDFLLDSGEAGEGGRQRMRVRHRSRRRSNSLVEFHLDNQLEDIIEESDYEFNSIQSSSSQELLFEDYDDISYPQSEKPSELNHHHLLLQAEYKEKIEKYLKDPKVSLLREIRRLAQLEDQLNQNQKLENIKRAIQLYLVDFELPSFEEAWSELGGGLGEGLGEKVGVMVGGIEAQFGRRVGRLRFEERRVKLLRYLQKKRMRKWRKKVSYDCRKKVADSRLRIKGKFVTREQVCQQLGIIDLAHYSGEEIKELLERRTQEKPE